MKFDFAVCLCLLLIKCSSSMVVRNVQSLSDRWISNGGFDDQRFLELATPVQDMSSTIVFMSQRCNSGNISCALGVQLHNTTHIMLRRGEVDAIYTISLMIAEFANGVSVRRGVTSTDFGLPELQNADLAHTFVLHTQRQTFQNWRYLNGLALVEGNPPEARLWSKNSLPAEAPMIYYQIVTCTSCQVQRVEVALTDEPSQDYPLWTPVAELNSTFMVFATWFDPGGGDSNSHVHTFGIRGKVHNTTHIRFHRGLDASSLDTAHALAYVVEAPDVLVAHHDVSFVQFTEPLGTTKLTALPADYDISNHTVAFVSNYAYSLGTTDLGMSFSAQQARFSAEFIIDGNQKTLETTRSAGNQAEAQVDVYTLIFLVDVAATAPPTMAPTEAPTMPITSTSASSSSTNASLTLDSTAMTTSSVSSSSFDMSQPTTTAMNPDVIGVSSSTPGAESDVAPLLIGSIGALLLCLVILIFVVLFVSRRKRRGVRTDRSASSVAAQAGSVSPRSRKSHRVHPTLSRKSSQVRGAAARSSYKRRSVGPSGHPMVQMGNIYEVAKFGRETNSVPTYDSVPITESSDLVPTYDKVVPLVPSDNEYETTTFGPSE